MKFKVAQEHLSTALQLVQKAAATRSSIPVLSGILIETVPEGLALTATDQELGIRLTLPAMVSQEGAFVFPARVGDIVRKIPFGEIAFEVELGNNTATITWERSRFIVHGYPAGEFPPLPQPASEATLTLTKAELRRLIQQTGFAVSHDDSRPVFTGVLLTVSDSGVRLVATDGFRLALAEGEVGTPPEGTSPEVIVPGRALAEVARVLGEEGDGPVEVSFSENRAFFTATHERVVCRLIEGQFPPYNQVIPHEFATRLVCPTQSLLSACERASLIAHEVGQAIKMQIAGNILVITASKPEFGNVREEVPVETQGDSLEIAFNPRYLIDGLRNISTEKLRYDFTGPLSPSCMRPVGDKEGSFCYIVLPMRLT
ncbi:MAG: DNA polymerase III subunit beta [Bacillota bacterium]|nr:MAG: DNA polymerase III subunit beta [Bacillota bacterium]